MKLAGRGSFSGGAGKRISKVEKTAWHPGVDVEFQGCTWANSDYCNGGMTKVSKPPPQGVLA